MLDVAGEERAAARARPAALAERDDPVAGERAEVLGGAEHGAPERVLAERGAVDQVLRDGRGLVVGAVDLLDHDAALAVELLGVEAGAPDEVGQQVDRGRGALGAHGDVEGDEVVAGVGVQHAAEPLGGLVDVAVVRVLLAALEDEVLEEVRHPVLLGTLVARARVEGDDHRQRARPRQADACGSAGRWTRRRVLLERCHALHPRWFCGERPAALVYASSTRCPLPRRADPRWRSCWPCCSPCCSWRGCGWAGTPNTCRASCAARSSTNHQSLVVDEALDRIARDYYRPVPGVEAQRRLDRRRGREPEATASRTT